VFARRGRETRFKAVEFAAILRHGEQQHIVL
jgi:hypothetical protein